MGSIDWGLEIYILVMADDSALQAGANRFSGFAHLYDDVRPIPPRDLGDVISFYCGGRPDLVVDLGSGTGLSCRWASEWAAEVVGVEPSDHMRSVAEAMVDKGTTRFRHGWSHDTGLPSGCADVVTAVQALHWMDPEPTFSEVARLLRPGGVFAAVDCDWPPVVGDVEAERAWDAFRRRLRVIEARLAEGVAKQEIELPVCIDGQETDNYSGIGEHGRRALPDGVRSWAKSEHLDRMIASGVFRWCREIALAVTEEGNARRFIDLLMSQGDYQTLKRHGLDDALLGVETFATSIESRLGNELRPWRFIYRARIGFMA